MHACGASTSGGAGSVKVPVVVLVVLVVMLVEEGIVLTVKVHE